MQMRRADWLSFFALSLLWGASFFFFKLLVDAGIPPLTIVFGRVALAALALLAYLRVRGSALPRSPRVWLAFGVMGALNNIVPYLLIVYAEARIASGSAAILNATTPIFSVGIAYLVARNEPLRVATLAGIALGFGGVAVLVGPDALAHVNATDLGQLACLGAALSYACAGFYGRRFTRLGVEPAATAAGQLCASSVLLLPLAAAIDHPWTLAAPSVVAWLSWIGIAVFCTSIAYVLYFHILRSAGATNVLLVTMLIPVSALVFGAIVLGERIGVRELAGMLLIAAGLLVIDGRILRRVRGYRCARAAR